MLLLKFTALEACKSLCNIGATLRQCQYDDTTMPQPRHCAIALKCRWSVTYDWWTFSVCINLFPAAKFYRGTISAVNNLKKIRELTLSRRTKNSETELILWSIGGCQLISQTRPGFESLLSSIPPSRKGPINSVKWNLTALRATLILFNNSWAKC